MNRDNWQQKLELQEVEIGINEGFKFLYCPWATLTRAKVAFISLNPGRPPDGADLRCVSDERGNSYEVEKQVTLSPITDQFLSMCSFIGVQPSDVLAGVAVPFRSRSWTDFTPAQKAFGLKIGDEFWSEAFNLAKLELVVVCSAEAAGLVARTVSANYLAEISAGWGSQRIRVYRSPSGMRVVHLPHLSRFRLFGRVESETALRDALHSSSAEAGRLNR